MNPRSKTQAQATNQARSNRLKVVHQNAKAYAIAFNLPYRLAKSIALQLQPNNRYEGEKANTWLICNITYTANKYADEAITRLSVIIDKPNTRHTLLTYDLTREATRTPIIANIKSIKLLKMNEVAKLVCKSEYVENLILGKKI